MKFPTTATNVIIVTPVTNENTTESMNYNWNVTPDDNLYRLYEGGDMLACNNCMDRGDIWYMKKHIYKMNKKQ
jgi:hypothetical protein